MVQFNDVPTPGESEAIQAMVQAVLDKQRKEHKPGTLARRDVHAKSHGTVRARFRVLGNIPASCKVGLFAQAAEYDADLRFSNGAFGPSGFDILPNIRGLGIKLYGVSGPKLLPGEERSTEHDFLMANDRAFFVPGIEQMLLLTQGKMKELAGKSPRVLFNILAAMMKLVKNPLCTDYHSQVPYRFGEYACKFALIAQERAPFLSLPNGFDKDYLRHSAEALLRRHDVKFTFGVQFQRQGESLVDSSKAWSGRIVPLAELTVTRNTRPILESDGEELSFNPWRALAEHEPLSWVGRARRAVYAADFQWRTTENKGTAN